MIELNLFFLNKKRFFPSPSLLFLFGFFLHFASSHISIRISKLGFRTSFELFTAFRVRYFLNTFFFVFSVLFFSNLSLCLVLVKNGFNQSSELVGLL